MGHNRPLNRPLKTDLSEVNFSDHSEFFEQRMPRKFLESSSSLQ